MRKEKLEEEYTPYCDSCGKDLSESEAFCESACVYCKECEESIHEHNERESRKQNELELLPCPFCGGESYLEDVRFCKDEPYEQDYAWIRCTSCGCRTKEFWYTNRIEEVKKYWNRRTPAVPQWTTEPPKEEGWYMVCYSGKHVDCVEVATGKGLYDSYRLGLYEEPEYIGDSWNRFVSIEDYTNRYKVTGWCKIDFPPLPERKESTK